jgi:hypothetical protein
MLSLASTGEDRIWLAKRLLVVELIRGRGPTWSRIQEVRERWGVEAQTQIPPRYEGRIYTPESLGPPPDPEEQFTDEADEWHAKYQEWISDLAALYNAVIPEEARSKFFVGSGWDVFLSICVLYDPPETQLREFADSFHWRGSNVHPRGGLVMYAPPIVWLSDAEHVEKTMTEFYEELLAALLEKYVHPQGVSSEDALGSIRRERRELFMRVIQELCANESRPYIDVKPHHTQKDIESAFRVLRARQDVGPPQGRPRRDKLTAVQCAILHDRRGWTYEQIALECGINPDSNDVSKYIADGRCILKDGQLA